MKSNANIIAQSAGMNAQKARPHVPVPDIFRGKIHAEGARRGSANDVYIPATEDDFKTAISLLHEKNFVLISMFSAENFENRRGFTLFYAFEKRSARDIFILERALAARKATSVAEIFPAACWYEREIADGFGIEFEGAFDKRRLFLHDTYPDDFHPLLKSFKNAKIKAKKSVSPKDEYQFKPVHGEGVYHIPVGPVHAGIIEPGHFRFSVIGETIFNLEVRMFYKHRGVEKIAEGNAPADCVPIAENISGDETVANAVAFCNAIESISKITVPARAWHLRTMLLEMERIYSHLGDMAGMIIDVAYPAGASPFFVLREEIFRQNEALTGSRFMKGIIGVGGLKKDVAGNQIAALLQYLDSFKKRFAQAVNAVFSSPSTVDRLETTGVVKKELIRSLNLTGPTARAAGAPIDVRMDHPYGIYNKLSFNRRTLERGDVLSRFEVKASEILESISMIQRLIKSMPVGKISADYKLLDGYALSVVEAPRGQSVHWVYIKNGVVDRYKVRTASFCNWQAIEHAVLGNIVPDFPLVNKSLNLSYAGTDL